MSMGEWVSEFEGVMVQHCHATQRTHTVQQGWTAVEWTLCRMKNGMEGGRRQEEKAPSRLTIAYLPPITITQSQTSVHNHLKSIQFRLPLNNEHPNTVFWLHAH